MTRLRAWREPAGRQRIVRGVIVVLGVAIAWAFAATVLRHTRPMALPLDDSYGALACARRIARGAGCPGQGAPLWSLVLAPLCAIGARGVWASFALSTALYVATALGVHRVVRGIAGEVAAAACAVSLLGIAAFASSALAGTEAAITGALLVLLIGALIDAPRGPPTLAHAIAVAGALLVGREAALIAIAVAVVRALQALRARLHDVARDRADGDARDRRDSDAFDGARDARDDDARDGDARDARDDDARDGDARDARDDDARDTRDGDARDARDDDARDTCDGVARDAHDGDARDGDARDGDARDGDARDRDARDGDARDQCDASRTRRLPWWRRRTSADAAAWIVLVVVPLLWRRALTGGWLALDVEHAAWRDVGRMLRAVFWDATSPLVWPRAVVVLWVIGAARVLAWARAARRLLAGVVIVAGPAVILLGTIAAGRWSADHGRFLAPALPVLWIACGCAFAPRGRARVAAIAALAALTAFAVVAVPGLVVEARQLAQAASDLDASALAAGRRLRRAAAAGAMAEQPGAVAYAADAPVDALSSSDGAGVLFEQLERLPADARPASFVIDPAGPAAAAIAELAGDVAFRGVLRPAFGPRLHAHASDLIIARWDHIGTGERPLNDHAGWAIVDRIDVADRDAELAHRWVGELDAAADDPPARRSVLGREVGAHGLILDGGRTVRGERFQIAADPRKPVRLVLRTGGARSYPGHDPAGARLDRAVPVRLLDEAGRELARQLLPPPDGRFVEVGFALPAGAPAALRIAAASPYRAFHWFVLQPE